MEIRLIRHGKTESNLLHRYLGRTDEALCPEGIREARALGSFPEVREVITSPLLRTGETARILFPAARLRPIAAFSEMDFGDFEGKTAGELSHDPAYRDWIMGNCLGPCPRGESADALAARCIPAFLELVSDALKAGKTHLVFVLHGGVIMALMERFARPKEELFFYHVKNLSGFVCTVEPALWETEQVFAHWERLNLR